MDQDLDTGYLLAVAAAAVWCPRPLVAMLRAFGSARALAEFAREPLPVMPGSCECLGTEALARIAAIDDAAARAAFERAAEAGLRYITSANPAYPSRLIQLCDPPPVLYYQGSLACLDRRAVAVVGSRAATQYGRATTMQFVREFAAYEVTIVSGLARGIDAAAHRAAIANGTPTAAVIGSGIHALYPPYHRELACEIVDHGGVVLTEFPPMMAARQHHFPMRNRLVAALSDAVLVVEAGVRSGGLITARLAADLGKHVFAVPGDIGRTASEGTNGLIKDGVSLSTGAADIAGVLGWTSLTRANSADSAEADVGDLVRLLRSGPRGADELCGATGLEAAAVSAQLLLLELQGLVERTAGGIYRAT